MTSSIEITHDAGNWPELLTHDFEHILQIVINATKLSEYLVSKPTITLVLTGNAHIQALNHDYRGKDRATNVLSFPNYDSMDALQADASQPWHEDGISLGDIVFAYETIESEAKTQKKTFHDHFTHLLIHGILHLLGYDHETEKEANQMESLEISILEQLSIANPY